MKPEALDEIARKINAESLNCDCREIAGAVGMENLLKLSEAMGGTQVYIPQLSTLLSGTLAQVIRKEYNGYNIRAMARQYSLSEQTVRNYLDGSPPKQTDGQLSVDDLIGKAGQ